jgi:hypothetical protein
MLTVTRFLSTGLIALVAITVWKSVTSSKQTAYAAGNRAYECRSIPENNPTKVQYFAQDCEVGTLALSNNIMCCFKK